MDPAALSHLAHQATEILVPAMPFIYAERDIVVAKVHDMVLEKGIEELGSKINKAKTIFDKLRSKGSEPVEVALEELSPNPKDPKAKEKLQQEILKLLTEDQNLAREIEHIIININVGNVDLLAFGNYNNYFKLETPSGEEYIKIIECLEQRRKEEVSKEIMSRYNSSALPDYPEKLKEFVTENRADELKKALTYLEKHKILLISGVGGVGKTTLARALVDFRPINVPEPFWFSFYDNQDAKLGDILEELAAYMKAPEITAFKSERREPGKIDVNKSIGELNNRSKIWLFFDDLNTMLEDTKFSDKGVEILFSSLRYSTHNANIIVTSRTLPTFGNGESLIDVIENEERQHINGLRADFAVDYLVKNGLGSLELNKLKELANGVDGHPLALKLLVEAVKEFGEEDALEDLSIYKEHMEDTILKARKLFDKLAGDEKELLERISVYRAPVEIKGIKEMFKEGNSLNSVKKLIDKSLLETDHKGKYWLHPLVQEFSYEDLENKKEAHLIAYNYYKSLNLPKNPTKKEDLQPAIEAHYHACEAGEYVLAADIIWESNVHNLLDLWGYSRTLIEIYEKLLPKGHFKGEPILKDKWTHGAVLGNLGIAYNDLGYPKRAIEYSEQALKIVREIGDMRNEGTCLGNLGLAYNDLGYPKKAIEYSEQSLKISREIGNRCGEGICLGNLGFAYRYLGYPKKAIEYSEQALKIAREIGDKSREGIWLGNLGNVYRDLGEVKKAIDYYDDVLKIAREIGDRRGEGIWLGNLGNAHRYLGYPKKAIDYYEQALKIARKIGNRRGEGICLGNMGNAYYQLDETKKAIEYSEESLKIAKEVDDRRKEGYLLGDLGNVYRDLGEVKKAIDYYDRALKIAREMDDRWGEENHLGNMGIAYKNLGEAKKAIEYSEQALKISREIGDRRGEGNHLGNLGIAYKNLGDAKKAIEFLKESLGIGKSIEDSRIISFCEQRLKELEGFNGP